VRAAEGWGRSTPEYIRLLPQVAPDDPQRSIWRRRQKSFALLLREVIDALAATRHRPLRVLDLGAGNAWLSFQLARRGHLVAAVDLSVDPSDGLGAHPWYDPPLSPNGLESVVPIQAEFDRLPLVAAEEAVSFGGSAVDVAIFNASLHYAADYAMTLSEALRLLARDGAIVIMDTPLYRSRDSGEEMVRERNDRFETLYGCRPDAVPAGENFLTFGRLNELADRLGVTWRMVAPPAVLAPWRRRWRRLTRRRELAEMPLIVGQRTGAVVHERPSSSPARSGP
jgi:SAM-dependent methyltransferase